LENGSLPYYGVEAIKKGASPHDDLKAARKVVLRLIRDLKPQVLAVEKTFFAQSRNTALLNVLVDEIQAIGKRKGLKVFCFAPTTMKKSITGNGRASKEDVARVIALQYPVLRVFLTQDRQWKERYHQNMFDAVGLGIMAMAKLGFP